MPDDSYERLRSLEAWLSNLYKDAEDDLREKWDAFMAKHEAAAEKLKAQVDRAATAEERKQAKERYQAYLRSATTGNRYYREMIAETAKQFAGVNQRAVEIVNGERSSFYSGGYNLSAGEINDVAIKQGVGIRFDMCSAEAVDWLAENRGRINLPPAKTLNYTEDERWSAKLLNSQVAQGIVQGESIPKIAERISNVTGAEQASAVRAARTMATECQNAGRVQAMENATANGVKTKKRWICTHDPRTRDTHLELDGEMEDPDGVFWNGCRWPGDHLGPPEEAWNCRCTLGTEIVGFASNLPKGKEGAVTIAIDGQQVYNNAQKTGFDLVRELRSARPADKMAPDELRAIGQAFYDSDEYRQRLADLISADEQAEVDRLREAMLKAKERYDRTDSEKDLREYQIAQELYRVQVSQLNVRIKELNSELIAAVRGEGRGFTNQKDIQAHLGKRQAVRNFVVDGFSRYPSSWVDASVDGGKIHLFKAPRGYYDDTSGTLALSDVGNNARNTAVHEIGHRMEQVMNLLAAEREYYDERTKGESLVQLKKLYPRSNYRDDEVTRKDSFVNPYMGKDYGGRSYELLSMGIEGVIGFTDRVNLDKDEDMRNWITGILLAY